MKEKKLKKLNLKNIIYFTSQLQILLNSSIPLTEALDVISKQAPNLDVALFSLDIKNKLERGVDLYHIIMNYPFLGNVYSSLIKAGLQSGKLPLVLLYLVGFLKKQQKLKTSFILMSVYPCFLILAVFVFYFLLGGFIFPQFIKNFNIPASEVPFLASFIMNSVQLILNNIVLIIFILISALFVLKFYSNSNSAKNFLSNFVLKIPKLNECFLYFYLVHYITVLKTAYESGMGIDKTFALAGETIGNEILNKKAKEIETSIKNGNTIADSFSKNDLMPLDFISIIAAGEKAGNLSKALIDVENIVQEKLDCAIDALKNIFMPALIIIISIFVAIFAICFMKIYTKALLNIF